MGMILRKTISKVDGYTAVVQRNHRLAYDQGEVIIRHLVLPNHFECCSKPILTFIAEYLPQACVNIMAQYRPEFKAFEQNDILRPITLEEVFQVKAYANDLSIHQI